jgi:hypothetical protein
MLDFKGRHWCHERIFPRTYAKIRNIRVLRKRLFGGRFGLVLKKSGDFCCVTRLFNPASVRRAEMAFAVIDDYAARWKPWQFASGWNRPIINQSIDLFLGAR